MTYRRPKAIARPRVLCNDGELHPVTVQVRRIRCGKSACSTCRDGIGHGPYVFFKYRSGQGVRTDYVGLFRGEEVLVP